ncbi:hypothetical protein DRO33_05575 [Candidatus Bathyarchaeota archaeon]|nr:MAG: hypothetical protein DRO33_05575 [Candidatus Bathyarchaeota archaeon]
MLDEGVLELVFLVLCSFSFIYFFLLCTRYSVLCLYALKYKKRRARYGSNKELVARKPFVSVMIPTYNEKNVVERVLRACLELDYDNYEIVVVDDSTDETVKILEKWARHPRIKVIHREHRKGWKGGALDEGLKHLDPRTEFIMVVDADCIPPRDAIQRMLGCFVNEKVAAVQGYQFTVLNADENWVTRAARTLMSTAYAVDYAGRFALGGAPQLGGGLMMLRRDVLDVIGGFGSSITEDYDMAVRLYVHGYEVFFAEDLKVLTECPSTFRDLVGQLCRWVEGRARDFKRRLLSILGSRKLSAKRKLDLLLDGMTNLAGFVTLLSFVVSILAAALNITVPSLLDLLNVPWPAQLAITIYMMVSYPLVQYVALRKEGVKGAGRWLASCLFALAAVAPFTAKALMKGLFFEATTFYRTYKTGRITMLERQIERLRMPTGLIPAPYMGGPEVSASMLMMDQRSQPFSLMCRLC